MRRLALAALALALAAPAGAAHRVTHTARVVREVAGPDCELAAHAMPSLALDPDTILSERLDGQDAARMLQAINTTGEPTSFEAKTLVVRVYADHVSVGFFSPCMKDEMVVDLDVFHTMLLKADASA